MFRTLLKSLQCLVLVLAVPLISASAHAGPQVAVSIAPLHSLVAGVMEGVGEPELIYETRQSPHASALSPSQLKTLVNAELLIWVGPELETGLGRLLERRPESALEMRWHDYDAGMTVHPQRESLFDVPQTQHEHEHAHDHGDLDPHFWLSPANARHFVEAVAEQLAQLDAPHADRYRANAERLTRRLTELEQELSQQLAAVRQAPFILFHDGFQYFDQAFDLNALGALVLNPEIPPGPRTVANLKAAAERHNGVCLFHEPQFSDRWLRSLSQSLPSARIASIDPLGIDHAPGRDLYLKMMRQLANDMTRCLEALQ